MVTERHGEEENMAAQERGEGWNVARDGGKITAEENMAVEERGEEM